MKNLFAVGILASLAATLAAGCATPPTEAARLASEAKAAKSAKETYCLRDTGSRIKLKDDECNSSVGRVWSRDELDSTGEISTGDALRQLDPRFQ